MMKVWLQLNSENAKGDIVEFKHFLESQNIKGVKLTLVQGPHEEGKLGLDWANLVQVGLTATGTGIAIKGFFDLLKAYFVDLKKHRITSDLEAQKNEREIKGKIVEKMIENSIATIIIQDKDGIEQTIPLNRFSDDELKSILSYL